MTDKKRIKESKSPVVEEPLEHLPFWSSIHTNQPFPYVPQVKDTVIYFPQPHLEFLRRNGRKLKEKFDFEEIVKTSKPYHEGVIDEIEYIAGEYVKCKIVLRILIGRKWTRISLNYFFGTNQPNYLVLKSLFSSNSEFRFKENETVKIRAPPCQNENGIVLEIKTESDPSISFGAYKILW